MRYLASPPLLRVVRIWLLDEPEQPDSLRLQTMQHHVFVFGTLKEGFPNFHAHQGTRVPGTFITRERFPLYLMGERHSPWLIHSPGEGHRIQGHVFEVDTLALAAMDKLERTTERDGYRRVVLDVESTDSGNLSILNAHVYVKQPAHLDSSEIRLGPLAEYTHEHAALYRPRSSVPPMGGACA